jgi:5'(3')-deoxyribonucleotidase
MSRLPYSAILLDQDGPLADLDRRIWEIVRELGIPSAVSPYPEFQTARYATDHFPRKHRKVIRDAIDAPGFFADLHPTAGAKEGVAALLAAASDAGLAVNVCTKPQETSPTCRDEKKAWLTEHFPDLADEIYMVPDKSRITGDVLLDDAILPEWLAAAVWRPVVFTMPYNLAGSVWEHWEHWTWGDPISRLHPLLQDGSVAA